VFKKSHKVGFLLLSIMAASYTCADIIDGEDFVDPTRPIIAGARVSDDSSAGLDMNNRVIPSSFEVSFVRVSEDRSMAVVNNQRVSTGDEVDGATVVAIDRSGVTLSINDEETRVNLYGTDVKAAVTEN
jgi:hypothetical protein